MSFCKKKERKLAHCLELRIVGSMKKILLIYSDSLVLNIPRSGNISTTLPGYFCTKCIFTDKIYIGLNLTMRLRLSQI